MPNRVIGPSLLTRGANITGSMLPDLERINRQPLFDEIRRLRKLAYVEVPIDNGVNDSSISTPGPPVLSPVQRGDDTPQLPLVNRVVARFNQWNRISS